MSASFPESSTDLPVAGQPLTPAPGGLAEEAGLDWELVLAQALEEPNCRQLIYRHSEGDREIVQAMLEVHWAAGETIAVVHLPLVPPLEAAPHVEAELAMVPEARLRVTDRQPFGVRVEVALPRAVTSTTQHRLQLVVQASRKA